MRVEEIQAKLPGYLSERLGRRAQLVGLRSLSGGACLDNYLVDLEVGEGEAREKYALVLRMDRGGALFGSISRADEYALLSLMFERGVQTPKPFLLEANRDILGSPFYLMERLGGRAEGRYIVRDPALKSYRKQLCGDLVRNLAVIHGVRLDTCEVSELKSNLRQTAGAAAYGEELGDLRQALADMEEYHPAIELGFNWLAGHSPSPEPPVLVHGDFRTGNFLVSSEGLQGVLDWEFAHWGDGHEDLAWLCMRDWRFGKIKLEAGGFAGRAELYAAYEQATGRAVDRERMRYWEIMGNVRWAVASVQQGHRHSAGVDKGIELAAIGRRTCEMEFEVLRLIEDAG